mmetsp:Transcript_87446/g.183019  ORF Transcript_87446/g.183019 Transcript_87446/m.183019 type:complete len:214 (+) Transcript_87446:193-834(+)
MVRPHRGQVWTRCGCIGFVLAFLEASARARLMSSTTTQPETSRSCSCNHIDISKARRSVKDFNASEDFSNSKVVTVVDDQGRTCSFVNLSDNAFRSGSLLLHSLVRTTFALVRSTMCLRALSACGKKSEVSTPLSLSPGEMSKPPARAGLSTPSMSKKRTLLLSSELGFATFLLSISLCNAASAVACCEFGSRFGSGMSPYSAPASFAARSAC